MKRFLIVLLILAAIGGIIFAFIEGRAEFARERERESPVKAPSRVSVAGRSNVVHFDAAAREQTGIAIGVLESVTHRAEVQAFGVVLDPAEITAAHGALQTAAAQLRKAEAALEVARAEFERQRTLRNGQNVSEKAFQTAEGDFRAETANVSAAQTALNSARATAHQRWGDMLGEWLVTDSPELAPLERREKALLQITLPTGTLLTAPPETATVRDAAGKEVPARLLSASPRTDAKLQGRSFFYLATPGGAALLAGSQVIAALPAGEPQPGLRVPADAVVWLHGKAWIYAEIEPDRFTRHEISTERPMPDGWFQPATFTKEKTFVVRGPQVLLSEEFRAQILIGEEAEGR